MRQATATATSVEAPLAAEKPAMKAAIAIGLAAVVWFMVLSGWMKSAPGSVMVKRQNVLFNSDSSIWLDRMVGNARSPEQMIHPLEIVFWRLPCRALGRMMRLFAPADEAAILGARLLVALVYGVGVAFLAFLALRLGVKLPQCVLLFIVYFLFTSNCTAALPEHFGISNGLLSVAFVGPILLNSLAANTIFLAAMVILCGGTTITNALYPLAAIWQYSFKTMRSRMKVLAAAIPLGVAGFLFFFLKSYTIHHFVGGYLTMRWIRDPFRACIYAVYAVVCPAVGPTPLVMRVPGWDMVSYEPAHHVVQLSYYLGLQAVGAVAWAVLLVRGTAKALHHEATRVYVWLPLGWIVFSILFHNVWGDEMALYSPHWSWALMALVILGARQLRMKFVATLFVPIVVSQIYTLIQIHAALGTITR